MNKIRCLVVDDEKIAQRIIIKYLEDLGDFEVIATCINAMEAMLVLEKESIDLMFLDIEMPKLSGMAFLKTLKHPPAVIITTAHREYALEGFELDVIDYLLKPISFERFIKASNKFKKTIAKANKEEAFEKKQEVIYVKSERKTIKLNLAEIFYIEGMNNYVIIHTSSEKHIVYNTISFFLDSLNSDFIRIHKSFLINRNKISSFTKEQVTLGAYKLPIGRTYKDRLSEF